MIKLDFAIGPYTVPTSQIKSKYIEGRQSKRNFNVNEKQREALIMLI